jgi:DNA transformation protein
VKNKAVDSFVAFVIEQLVDLRGLGCRAMFGGHGLYRGATFFGILFDGRLYLKTDESTSPEYERRGSRPFRPNDEQVLKSYYEVPADVLENRDELLRWAEAATRAAGAGAAQGRRRRTACGGARDAARS